MKINDLIKKIKENNSVINRKYEGVVFDIRQEEDKSLWLSIPTKDRKTKNWTPRREGRLKEIFNAKQVILVDDGIKGDYNRFWSIELK